MAEHNKLQKTEHEIYLEFKVGPLHFCAPIAEVESIISLPKMSTVPINAGVMASCFDHNGRTATVIDLHSKFGLPFKFAKNRTHIILATVENELKGFWVDRAIDIAPLSNFEKDNSNSRPLSNAYFNYLLRDREIVLQTSFLQLFKCHGSDLNWLPDGEVVEDAQSDEALEPVTTESSEGTTGAEDMQSEATCHEPQVQSPIISTQSRVDDSVASSRTGSDTSRQTDHEVEQHKVMPFVNRDAIRQSARSSNKQHTGQTVQASRTLRTSSPQACSIGVESINAHEHKIEHLAQHRLNTRLQNNSSSDWESNWESNSNNKADNKKHKFIWLTTAVLALLALGFTFEYLMHDSARLETVRASVNVGTETVTVNKTPFEKAEPIAEVQQVEPAATMAKKSEDEFLNRIAQEPEAGATLPESGRVFELHVSEQTDSASYAITSFSPAGQQQTVKLQQQYTHVVVKGDTLWDITRRYLHDPNRYRELATASDIDNPNRIYPGDVIKIFVNEE